jgi:fermentation-respiration switch protein FrsA (DUF1100 family)
MLLFLLALAGGLTAFYLINAYIGGRRYGYPARIRISFASPADYDRPYEEVKLTGRDGVRLAGWYIPGQNKAALILLHGYSGNRLAVMFHAQALAQAGFGVLMMDLRAHGHSGGRGTFARGESMISDTQAMVDFLRDRPEVDAERIGILGVSIGGTMALQATARIPGLAAVVSDGAGPAAYDDLLPAHNFFNRVVMPVNRLFFHVAERSAPVDPLPPNQEVVGQIAPRPVLIISTGKGGEAALNERIYDAAREPKTYWPLPDAPHAGAWNRHPEAYAETIITFFQEILVDSEVPGTF